MLRRRPIAVRCPGRLLRHCRPDCALPRWTYLPQSGCAGRHSPPFALGSCKRHSRHLQTALRSDCFSCWTTAVKAATDAATAAAEHVPNMDYSLAEAGFLLSRSKRELQYELDEGPFIGAYKGASHRISQAEMERQVLRDDGKPGTKERKTVPKRGTKDELGRDKCST